MLKLMARSAASQLGREVVRGVLGSLLGGRRRYQSPVVDVNDHV